MFYIAKCYVGHAGATVRPGEAFEAESQDEKIDRLIRMGAIVPATPAFATAEHEDSDNDQQDDAQDTQENGRQQMDNLGYDASGNHLEAEDTDEEAEEAPEIDGLDGIIADNAEDTALVETEKAPVKKNGRKKS